MTYTAPAPVHPLRDRRHVPYIRYTMGLLKRLCGEQVKGKSDIGGYENDCSLILIYEKLRNKEGSIIFPR
jgi:hypothetical protein